MGVLLLEDEVFIVESCELYIESIAAIFGGFRIEGGPWTGSLIGTLYGAGLLTTCIF